jgi:Protein of unknown function (DUF2628)
MRLYTVHIRPVAGDDDPDVVLVPEGFSWFAFLLAPAYAAWHREWLGLVVYLVLAVGLAYPLQALGMSETAQAAANLALSLIVGWHAGDWRRWRLGRRGYRLAAVVAGRGAADAEYRFFTHWRFSRPTTLPALNLLTQ